MTPNFDQIYLDLAYNLALQGKVSCFPNPAVGAVIVKNNTLLSTGFHQIAGQGHAERIAIENLKEIYPETWQEQIAGATIYVTLEPCAHYGRTPPCANLLVDCKVARVVYSSQDPTPKVNGKGAAILQAAGIEVDYIPHSKAQLLNKDWLLWETLKKHELPFIGIKMGASLDGKVALANGTSKWITSSHARSYVQALRWSHHALLCSAQTLIIDQAQYTVRPHELPIVLQDLAKDKEQPVLVVLDNRQQLTGNEPCFKIANRKIIIVSQQEHYLQKSEFVQEKGSNLEFIIANSYTKEGLVAILMQLKAKGLEKILVETGSQLASTFINWNLYHQIHYFIGNKILGQGLSVFKLREEFYTIDQVPQLELLYSQNLNESNVYLVYGKK